MTGPRPVVDSMFLDFILDAFDALVNQAAKMHYMTGGQVAVPMVLHTVLGAGRRGAAQHSQSLEALLRDSAACRFVPVMLAEELSRYITSMMIAELKKLRMPVQEVIVNRLAHGLRGCPVCDAREARQDAATTAIEDTFSEYFLWGLPLFTTEGRGAHGLSGLWASAHPLKVNAPGLHLRVALLPEECPPGRSSHWSPPWTHGRYDSRHLSLRCQDTHREKSARPDLL